MNQVTKWCTYLMIILFGLITQISLSLPRIDNITPFSFNSFLSTGVTLISSGMLAYSLLDTDNRFVSGLFWIFNCIFFGVTPLLLSLDPNPIYLASLASTDNFASAYLATFIATLLVALVQTSSKQKSEIAKSEPRFNSANSVNLFRIKIGIGFYLIFLFPTIQYLGGVAFLTSQESRIGGNVLERTSIGLILENILVVVPLILSILLLIATQDKRNEQLVPWKWIFLSWSLILSNPLVFSRQQTLFVILPLIYFFRVRWRFAIRMFLLTLPLVVAFAPYVTQIIRTRSMSNDAYPILSRTGDFDAFAQFATVIKWSSMENFSFLHQISGSLLFFIPRSIWANKPFDTGLAVAQMEGLRFQNLSAPWLAEAYVNAGWGGILLIAIIVGYSLGRSQHFNLATTRITLLSSIVVGSMFILLRGSLLQATGRIALALVLSSWFLKTRIETPIPDNKTLRDNRQKTS